MLKYLQKKYVLSRQGANLLVKGAVYSTLCNLSMMLPVGLFVLLLNELLAPLWGGALVLPSLAKYTVLCFLTAAVIFFVHLLQYDATLVSTYSESAVRRTTLAEKLRTLPLSFFSKRDLSDLTATIMGDCANMEHTFSHALPQLYGAAISTTIVGVAMAVMDWRMALAILWVLPVSLLMIFGSKSLQDKSGRKYLGAKRDSADVIQECLETVKEIKACNKQEVTLKNIFDKLDTEERIHIKTEMITSSLVTSAQMVLRLGIATVILVGAWLLLQEQISFTSYLIFLIAASIIYDPLAATLPNIAEVFHVRLQAKRMIEIEDYPEQSGADKCEPAGYDLAFNDVSFSYDGKDKILEHISFMAKQGEITAVVGPTRSGKTTLAELAARFWNINSGMITLGGVDISGVEPETLLRNFSIVFQEVTLFNDTVMENIRLGRKGASDDEVIEAAKSAQCQDFILNLPNGYQTILGENGDTLSGGERQRLSIARALLKDSPVVLLDNATASLDADNETQVQKAISRLVQNKTVLVIAQRLRTVASADKIIVLDGGKIVEQGKPDDLMKKDGLYHHMVTLQTESANWSL